MHKPKSSFQILRILLMAAGVVVLIFSMTTITRIPLHQRALIQGIAIDWENEQFQVTVQAVSTSPTTAVEVYQAEGDSVYDALNNIALVSGKMPFYTHNAIVIVGRECAEYGLEHVMDFFVRHHETRPAETVFAAKEKAADILTLKTDVQISMNNQQMQLNQYVMASQIQQLTASSDLNSQLLEMQVLDTANSLYSSGDVLLPVLAVNGQSIAVEGCAVFRSGKLQTMTDQSTVSGIKAVKDSLTGGAITIPLSDAESATLSFKQSSCKTETSLRKNVPHFDLQISCQLNINEINRPLNRALTQKDFTDMEQLAAARISTLIDETLTMLIREYQADVFSFSDVLLKQQTAWWKLNEKNWRKILPKCTWSITVDAVIVTEGQEMSPQILQIDS